MTVLAIGPEVVGDIGPDSFTVHQVLYRVGRRALVADPLDQIITVAERGIARAEMDPDILGREQEKRIAAIREAARVEIQNIEDGPLAELIKERTDREYILSDTARFYRMDRDEARVQAPEIRSEALKRSPEERLEMYIGACERDDRIAIHAFETASAALDLLPDREASLERGREVHAASFAESYPDLVEARAVVESVEDDLKKARRILGLTIYPVP